MDALVRNPVVDVRGEPKFESERISQLEFNMVVEIGDQQDRYTAIQHPRIEGVGSGWVYTNHLDLTFDPDEVKDQQLAKVTAQFLPVYDQDRSRRVSVLPFNSTLRVYEPEADWALIGSSKQPLGWVERQGLVELSQIKFSVQELLDKGQQFLGVPYLWGGSTPFGIDCSGYVLTLMGYYGMEMPHITDEQEKLGTQIGMTDIQPGDLFFWDGHVAVCLDKNSVIHANLYGGGVTINSMKKGAPDYHPVFDEPPIIKRIRPHSA